MENIKTTLKGFLAGIAISFGGFLCIRTNAIASNTVLGSFLFSFGLILICNFGFNLYTGKVGYVKSKSDILELLVILGVNIVAAFLVGLLVRSSYDLGTPYASRLLKSEFRIFLDGVFCGMLIYLAVELYKKTSSLIPVIMCVMAFILAGFEHSIADAYFLGVQGLTLKGAYYLLLIVVGNGVGSLVVRHLQLLSEKQKIIK